MGIKLIIEFLKTNIIMSVIAILGILCLLIKFANWIYRKIKKAN